MPAVEAVCRELRRECRLDDVGLLVRLHGYNSVIRTLGVLGRLRLDLADVTWLQKLNSTSPGEALGLGIAPTVGARPRRFPFTTNPFGTVGLAEIRSAARCDMFSNGMASILAEQTHRRMLSKGKRIAIMEDGGMFAKAAAQQGLRIAAIAEQTSRGGREIERLGLSIPTTAVYRWKPGHENPVIGFDVVEKTAARVHRNGVALEDAFRSPLVVGGGNVGAWVAARLQMLGFRPLIDEPRPEAMAACCALLRNSDVVIRSDAERRDAWQRASCVIECVGNPVLKRFRSWPFGRKVILSEASSDNWGFDGILDGAWGTVVDWPAGIDDRHPNPGVWLRLQGAESDPLVRHPEGEAMVLNCGFTINLDGGPEPIPPALMQGTRAAMVAGIAQALSDRASSSIVPLDREMGDVILKAGDAALGPLLADDPHIVLKHVETVYRSAGLDLTIS